MQGSQLVLQLVVGEQAASVFHPHPQHLQAAQRDGGQHDVEQHAQERDGGSVKGLDPVP